MSWDSLSRDDLLRPTIRRTSSLTSSSPKSYETPMLGEIQRMLWTPVPCRGNVNEVWPNLYIGDLYIARDIEQLRRMGITHIVNAAAGRFHIDTGAKFYKDLPVDYYGVKADDDPKFDLSIYFYPTAKYIRAALHSPRGTAMVSLWMAVSTRLYLPVEHRAKDPEDSAFFHKIAPRRRCFARFTQNSQTTESSWLHFPQEDAVFRVLRNVPPAGKVLVHCAMGISRSATLVLAFLMICENKTLVDALNTVRRHRGVCPNSGFLSQLRDLDIRLMSERGRGGPLNL